MGLITLRRPSHGGIAKSGIIAPPIIDIGIRNAHPAALVDCSFRPADATSIMMPTKQPAAAVMAARSDAYDDKRTSNTPTANANMAA